MTVSIIVIFALVYLIFALYELERWLKGRGK